VCAAMVAVVATIHVHQVNFMGRNGKGPPFFFFFGGGPETKIIFNSTFPQKKKLEGGSYFERGHVPHAPPPLRPLLAPHVWWQHDFFLFEAGRAFGKSNFSVDGPW
jgi:hypothetical protein